MVLVVIVVVAIVRGGRVGDGVVVFGGW